MSRDPMSRRPRRAGGSRRGPHRARRTSLALGLGLLVIAAPAVHLGPGDALAAIRSVLVLGAGSSVMPRGVYHGWVSPTQARVRVEAAPCPAGDPPTRLTLQSGTRLTTLLGSGPPPVTLPLDGMAATSVPASRGTIAVLDLSSAFIDGAGGEFTRGRVHCRSWRETAWELGALSVTRVDGPATPELPLLADLVPEPSHTGVYAVLLLRTSAETVTVEAVDYAPARSATGRVVVGVGRAEHWQEWREALRRWSEAGARGEVEVGPEPVRPYWLPEGPTPPLEVRDAGALDIVLEPHSTALVAIGAWSFKRPPERLLSFPTVRFEHAGVLRHVGLVDHLLLTPRARR